jgi:hypothetical protein
MFFRKAGKPDFNGLRHHLRSFRAVDAEAPVARRREKREPLETDSRSGGSRSLGRAHREKARNEKAVKCLKTNNSAKSLIRRAINDFNHLRPAMRNVSFRIARDSFRFSVFLTVRRKKRDGSSRRLSSRHFDCGRLDGREKLRKSAL